MKKHQFLIISFCLGLFFVVLIAAALIGLKTQAESKLIFPEAKLSQKETTEQDKSISYYITTSQKFLNQARLLANNNSNQTSEEKQAIIKQVEKALEVINQGIQAYPLDDRVYSQRANLYQSLTSFLPEANKYAMADLTQAIQINSKNPDYYQRLAGLYQQSGDFENAASALFNAHQLSPLDSQILYDLANALVKSGQIDKAIRYYDKLISLLPPDDQNLENLKKQKTNLEKLLVNANLEQLSEPGLEMIPEKPTNSPQPIIGTEELPLEQAMLASQLIIASPEEKSTMTTNTGEVATNAKTGKGTLTAGETEVTIFNNHVANDKQIVIVASSDTQNKVIHLIAKKAGEWFKVGLDTAIDTDIEFDWWIID